MKPFHSKKVQNYEAKAYIVLNSRNNTLRIHQKSSIFLIRKNSNKKKKKPCKQIL